MMTREVISDTEAVLVEELGETSPLHAVCQGEEFMNYDILGFIDQGQMFHKVETALSKGSCLGIFPEGGSHDHTDLLPLKVSTQACTIYSNMVWNTTD
jgi:glycerol-3-phosphate O-acyltransferase/dihydroxyacetone phosphate acyltransferase